MDSEEYHMLRKKSVQHAVLEDLAKNPDSVIKPISKRKKKDYNNTYEALKKLEEQHFITKGEKKKTRGGLFPGYRLTEKGLAYVMVYGEERILHQALVKYEKHLPDYKEYLQLTNLISQKAMVKLLRLAGKATLDFGRVVKAEDWLILIGSGWAKFTSSERREVRRAAHKVGSIRRGVQKAAKDLYEFAFPDE